MLLTVKWCQKIVLCDHIFLIISSDCHVYHITHKCRSKPSALSIVLLEIYMTIFAAQIYIQKMYIYMVLCGRILQIKVIYVSNNIYIVYYDLLVSSKNRNNWTRRKLNSSGRESNQPQQHKPFIKRGSTKDNSRMKMSVWIY